MGNGLSHNLQEGGNDSTTSCRKSCSLQRPIILKRVLAGKSHCGIFVKPENKHWIRLIGQGSGQASIL